MIEKFSNREEAKSGVLDLLANKMSSLDFPLPSPRPTRRFRD